MKDFEYLGKIIGLVNDTIDAQKELARGNLNLKR